MGTGAGGVPHQGDRLSRVRRGGLCRRTGTSVRRGLRVACGKGDEASARGGGLRACFMMEQGMAAGRRGRSRHDGAVQVEAGV